MRTNFLISALIGAFCVTAGTAQAQIVGEVVSTGGADGNVLVTREGQTYPILDGDPLFDGDIITTRRGSSATLSASNCRLQLSASEQVTVSDRMCEPGAILPAALPNQLPQERSLITPARLVIGGATVGVIAALLRADDDDDEPVSP